MFNLRKRKTMDGIAKIHLKNGKLYNMTFSVLSVLANNLQLKEISDKSGTLLMLIRHEKIQTYIDVSGIENHLLLSFDDKKMFIGTTFCHSPLNKSFILASQAKFAILIELDDISFAPCEIISLEI